MEPPESRSDPKHQLPRADLQDSGSRFVSEERAQSQRAQQHRTPKSVNARKLSNKTKQQSELTAGPKPSFSTPPLLLSAAAGPRDVLGGAKHGHQEFQGHANIHNPQKVSDQSEQQYQQA